MIDIEVKRNGTDCKANIKMEGSRGDLANEIITLLEALESNKESRDLLHHAIDYRINSLIKEYRELEDDGEL